MKNADKSAYPTKPETLNSPAIEGGLTKREFTAIEIMKEFIGSGWTDYETAAKNSIEAANILFRHLEK